MTGDAPRRRVLHGRRRGRRLREGQRALARELLPALEIAAGDAPLSPPALFGPGIRDAWLEIGFGAGEHLAWQAAARPDVGMIGCEPFANGVVALLREVRDRGLGNVRICADDARLLLPRLAAGSIGRAFVLFPDPWPKTRHHKRRVVCGPVLAELARAMRDGAELRIATDDRGYLEWILAHLGRQPAFEWTARSPRDWRERPDDWPPTRYERKAREAGRGCAYLRHVRRPRARAGPG